MFTSRRSVLSGSVGALLVLGMSAPASLPVANAVESPPGVLVVNADDAIVATFTSAKCKKGKRGFVATAEDNGYTLEVNIDDFKGFGDYDLTLGRDADPYVTLNNGPKNPTYSNLNEPPFPSPGFGAIHFKNRGKLMGVGFHPAWAKGGNDAVSIAGGLKCKYPKPKR